MAVASYVEFHPDQEPFTPGVIEPCGVETITAATLIMHWCPKCKEAQSIEADGCWDENT